MNDTATVVGGVVGGDAAHSYCYERQYRVPYARTLQDVVRCAADPLLAADVIGTYVPEPIAVVVVSEYNRQLRQQQRSRIARLREEYERVYGASPMKTCLGLPDAPCTAEAEDGEDWCPAHGVEMDRRFRSAWASFAEAESGAPREAINEAINSALGPKK